MLHFLFAPTVDISQASKAPDRFFVLLVFFSLTDGIVKVRVPVQVSDQGHGGPLHVDSVGLQQRAEHVHAVQLLHDDLAHGVGHLCTQKANR